MTAAVVIVGAGQAGYQTAESLRQEGHGGPIVLIGEEPHAPYQRPPLSKAYLLGETDAERIRFRAPDYYAQHGIDLRLDSRVVSIDRTAKRAVLADGSALAYDRLVLATGTRVRPLAVPGAGLDGVFTLKTLDDVARIQPRLERAARVVVIGAGFIGLEFAAVARKLGKAVTVLEAAPRIMGRVVHPSLSDYFTAFHRARGVTIVCSATVAALDGDQTVRRVVCADGSVHDADLVVVGIGVLPNVELAQASGLACDNGVVVDCCCRTADPDVFAVGDCTAFAHPFAGTMIRLESVQNAADQGRAAAAAIAGTPKPYGTVPWFWSDQYELKLQMVGLTAGCDQVVTRGDRAADKFSLFHYRDGVLRAVDSVSRPADHMAGRKLLAAGVSPTPEQAADEGFKLNSLLG